MARRPALRYATARTAPPKPSVSKVFSSMMGKMMAPMAVPVAEVDGQQAIAAQKSVGSPAAATPSMRERFLRKYVAQVLSVGENMEPRATCRMVRMLAEIR